MRRWHAIALALLLTSCGSGPRLRPLGEEAVIVAFGDSLTAGSGAGPGLSYPERLAERMGRTVINAGVPGETTEEGLARLPGVLAEHRPDLVILCEGGNDMLRRQDVEATASNLREMVGLIRASGADVLLVGVPNPTLLLKTAPLYEELADELAVPCECSVVADVLSRPGLKSDQIHPNAQGYDRIAEALARALDRAGAL